MAQLRIRLRSVAALVLGLLGLAALATLVVAQGPAEAPAVIVPSRGAAALGRLGPIGGLGYRAVKARAVALDVASQEVTVLPWSGHSRPRARLARLFPGLDQPQSGNYMPPDTTVAKSPNRVLEATHRAIRLFDPTGQVIHTRSLNGFFGASPTEGLLFNPRLYFDRNAANRRVYAVTVQLDEGAEISRIWLAVSKSPDPVNLTDGWCRYGIPGTLHPGSPLSSWADFPNMGMGADKLVITTNQFTFHDDHFTFATVRVLNKLALSNNATRCPPLPTPVTFLPARSPGDGSFYTLQPVQHYTGPSSGPGAANPVYLLGSQFGASRRYLVWRVRNLAPPALDGPLVLEGAYAYDAPPEARQPASSLRLDTGDAHLLQAAGVGDLIAGVHATACGTAESCVRYVGFRVSAATGRLTAAIREQETLGGGAGTYYFNPGLAMNALGATAVVFNASGESMFLSTGASVKTEGGFGPVVWLNPGSCAYQAVDNPAGRTGDYVGAQTDPSDMTSFWLAGERATAIGGHCRWQTRVLQVAP